MSQGFSLILASASPRRRQLLAGLGLSFTVVPSEVDEPLPEGIVDPAAYARGLAMSKAKEIAGRYPDSVVLAADTVVVLDGHILGKPRDNAEAWSMLCSLRDRAHQVITAVVVARGEETRVAHETTDVVMRDYSDDEIAEYIRLGEPFDKAGAYGIQHQGFRPVDHFEGCYCNVVGLPLSKTVELLEEAGVHARLVEVPPECLLCV